MTDILITDFPMSLNGRWGTCSDHIVIHGNGSVTYTDGHNFENAKAMEVVRCKDCRYFRKFLRECERSGALTMYPLHDTDFCSYGEREE